ncbi:SLBB domain-containing protein [Phycicoccus sp. HDW14]|uniref:SLBB domain-containing protein n=1 Tax=Phycicoccus sp. HDW14 TaxID=2714941 RepID=UPI001F0E7F5F|nr:SLBB domain-containing protein [Phycicoccus sp. HDW14]
MRDRPDPTALSPRALAWLRGGRASTPSGGWVPRVPERPSAARGGEGPETVEFGNGGWGEEAPERVGRPERPEVPERRERPERLGGPGRWVRLPSALSGARWQPGRAAVLGVVLVTVAAVLVLGLRVAWARSDDGDVVAPGGGARAAPSGVSAGAAAVGVPSGASPSPVGATPSTAPSPGSTGVVVVHVVGQVRRPGLQRLPVGSRVSDAVDAAGGASRGADLSAVNLARLLVDGEQVRVPKPGEVVADGGTAGGAGGGAGGGAAPAGARSR